MNDLKISTNPFNNIENISDYIDIILYNNHTTNVKEIKIRQASEFLIRKLIDMGQFINFDGEKYFFSNKERKLFNIFKGDFTAFFTIMTKINKQSSNFKLILSNIEDYIIDKGSEKELYEYNHYDRENNILYLNNNNGTITKITSKGITNINNGENGVIFKNNDSKSWKFQKKELIEKISYFGGDSNYSFIDQLINSLNIEEGILKKKDIKLLLKAYMYSIFFNNLFYSKILLVLIGAPGSGKSFFLEIIQKILIGSRDLITISPNQKELRVNLVSNYLSYYDNVDGIISSQIIDLLCLGCNGGNIKYRKLYSDDTEIKKKVKSYIALTANDPHFQRKDLTDRMLKIDFTNKKEYNITIDKIYENIDKNYNYIMSEMVINLQKIIVKFDNYKNYNTSFRLNEFAKFFFNIYKEELSEDNITDIFKRLKKVQEDFTNTNDQIIDLLEDIFEYKNPILDENKYYYAKDLHEKLFNHSSMNKHLKYDIKSANSLGIKLTQRKGISDYGVEVIENSIKTGNKKSYKFIIHNKKTQNE